MPSKKKENSRVNYHKKNKTINVLLKSALVVLLLAMLVVLTWGAKMVADITNTSNSGYKPRQTGTTLNGKDLSDLNENIDPLKDPISILLLGIDDDDERALGSARTDTMLLATINPSTEEISMVSIPRDTYVQINTKKFQGMDKINSAYTYGNDEGAIQAVQDLMNIPINYYLTLDFQAFEEVVNALGGIEIDVPFSVVEGDAKGEYAVYLEPGLQTLDGVHALAYARTRHIDNDIERGKRQQEVIQSITKKATEIGSITKYSKIIKAVDGHFWTDMPSDTMLTLAQSALTKNYKFVSYTFSWMSFQYGSDNASMVGLHEDSLSYISHKLRLSLGLDKEDYRDDSDFVFESNQIVSPKTYPEYGAIDD